MTRNSAKFKISHLPALLKDTFTCWLSKDPFKLSAVVAYYAILSLPALLILVLDLVGAVWGREIVQGQLTSEIASAFGTDTAVYVKDIMTKKGGSSTSVMATILGIGTLLYGATGVFYQLQNVFDEIWETSPKFSNDILANLFGRLKSFGFILIFGFLLLISFVLTSALSAFSRRINSLLPDGSLELAYIFDILISLGFIYLLFAAMFKFLPSTHVRWKAVKSGAALTALLFVIGKYLLAFYFAKAEPGSTYGAAGSIILVMLWVSYTSLILFFGAQFTKIFSDKYQLQVN
ncbi:YihY/virulence factor BrkB family protein [Maribacter hydrothermalis]|uniref:Ribonuclease BN n=1 Tax=Maribacter hydrothermalis TaxID=1836467 RepID=A0A1B7Z1D2_9FLAO|nr:YihY/virulence factor BrkB family protein [Maribacter hydrothermalis]APQ18147.1 ribonuclease BN [Maribacter hydrothermalis]OBR36494.1 ribonuclease BN [Maribacter hydrothermalis]